MGQQNKNNELVCQLWPEHLFFFIFSFRAQKGYEDFWETGPYWEIFYLRVTRGFSSVGFWT